METDEFGFDDEMLLSMPDETEHMHPALLHFHEQCPKLKQLPFAARFSAERLARRKELPNLTDARTLQLAAIRNPVDAASLLQKWIHGSDRSSLRQTRRKIDLSGKPAADQAGEYSYSARITAKEFLLEEPTRERLSTHFSQIVCKGDRSQLLSVVLDKHAVKSNKDKKALIGVLSAGVRVAGRVYKLAAGKPEDGRVIMVAVATDELDVQLGCSSLSNALSQCGLDLTSLPSVVKLAKRLPLLHTPGVATLKLGPEQVLVEADEVSVSGAVMTDGAGLIAADLAEDVYRKYMEELNREPEKQTPAVFQIRLVCGKGVIKGTLVTTPLLTGQIAVRPSMIKCSCLAAAEEHAYLRVMKVSKPWNPDHHEARLGRQSILLLAALGVPASTFEQLCDRSVKRADEVLHDKRRAFRAVKSRIYECDMYNVITRMLGAGFELDEPYLYQQLLKHREMELKKLREKCQLSCPQSAVLLGVPDPTKTLKPKQLYCRFSQGDTKVLHGQKCVVFRNPALHPGDMQAFDVIEPPAHLMDQLLPDVIYFSVDEACEQAPADGLSGGDYDGDIFHILWNSDIVEHVQCRPPNVSGEAAAVVVGEAVPEDPLQAQHKLVVCFIKCLDKSSLKGVTANLHMVWADTHGVLSEQCTALAQLHYKALDAEKTGETVTVPDALRSEGRPHFMDGTSHAKYHSHKLLGTLHDTISKCIKGLALPTSEKQQINLDGDMDRDGAQSELFRVTQEITQYNEKIKLIIDMQQLIEQDGPKKEDAQEFYEQARSQARGHFLAGMEGDRFGSKALDKASAAYQCAYMRAQSYSSSVPHKVPGFCWVVALDQLCHIKANCHNHRSQSSSMSINPLSLKWL